MRRAGRAPLTSPERRRDRCASVARVVIVMLCMVACRSTPHAPPPGTVVVALESRPAPLDPRFTTDANSSLVAGLVTAGLTATDERAEAMPDLADGWRQVSPTQYVFTVRADARFHDGTPVTAADVAATYRSVLDARTGSPKRAALAAVAAIDTPDAQTVVFTLGEVSAPFLETTNLGILPARLAGAALVTPSEVVGAGPFRIAAVLGDGSVDLAAHAGYMDGPPRIARVRFRIVPDGVVRALELASGTVHLVQNALDPDLLPWLEAQPGLELLVRPGTTFQYLGVSFRDPRLADRRVRQALAFALDRPALVRHVLRGTARPATGLLPPQHWAYEGAVATYAHDPEQAQRLLAESGLDATATQALRHFTYKTSTVELRRRIAEVFQADLARVGLGLQIRSYEWATFYDDIRRGNFELYALAWVGVGDPDVYYRIFHSGMRPPAGNNRGGYANVAMDALLEEARRAPDRDTRRRLYAEAQRLAAEDLPVIPLWWADNVAVKSTDLRGFIPTPDGDLRSLATATFVPGGGRRDTSGGDSGAVAGDTRGTHDPRLSSYDSEPPGPTLEP